MGDISFEQLNEVVGVVCNWIDRQRAPKGFAPTFNLAKSLAGTSLASAISAARNIRGGHPAHYTSFIAAINQTLSALHSLIVYADKSDSISSDLTGQLHEAIELLRTAQRELANKLVMLAKADEHALDIEAKATMLAEKQRGADESVSQIETCLTQAKERLQIIQANGDGVAELRETAEQVRDEQEELLLALKKAKDELQHVVKNTEKQSSVIDALLPKGASAGLAHAFASRGQELTLTKWIWFGAFVLSVGCLAVLAYNLVFQVPNTPQELWRHMLPRIPIAAPSYGWDGSVRCNMEIRSGFRKTTLSKRQHPRRSPVIATIWSISEM